MATAAPTTGYAPVNGLQMYYEIHGSGGTPLVLLHGAYMTIEGFGPLLTRLAETRQVIVPEMQAHGRTSDIDRPITYEQMADDTAALIRHLGLGPVDVFGYSMGGGVAIQLSIRHPELVRKQVVASAGYDYDAMQPELHAFIPNITPEVFAGSPIETSYNQVAPNPADFPKLVEKLKTLDLTPFDWKDQVPGIAAPTLIVVGDSDALVVEHAVEMYRQLGGGAMGDMTGPAKSRLAVLPGTTHYMPPGFGMLDRVDWLMAMAPAFLDEPPPAEGAS
jgi:pimeloyl-ACP methyl ester carboxylesterase